MKAFNVEDFTALIAIDWADRKHDVCEQNNQTNTQTLYVISSKPKAKSQKPKAINDWANNLKINTKVS